MKTKCRFLYICLLTLALAGSIYAQGVTGDLAVNVADPNGAAVPNATLTLKNVQENTTSAGRTDGSGNYVFGQLKPGSYSLDIKAEGIPAAAPE